MTEIIHYERCNKNKCIGYVDICVPITKPTNIVFRRIAHIQSGDRRWFNLPSFGREMPNGEMKFLKSFEFQTQVYNGQLMESLPEKVREYCAKNGIEDIAPMDFSTAVINSNDDMPF